MLSDISIAAKALYCIYKGHISRTRDDKRVWPGQITLALMLGVAKPESITKYNRELVAIGAIDIRKECMPRRNVYIIHELPPSGYEGATTYKEWYEINGSELAARREAAAAKTARARNRRSGTVPQKSGVQVPHKTGLHVPQKSGSEQEEVNVEEVNREEAGIEASSDGDHRPVNGSAPPLARRRTSPKTISDPLTKDTAADDSEAVKIASEYLDDEDAKTLVDYLRRDRNASTTAGHMRYLEDSGTAGITAMATTAQDWAKYLDGKHSHITSALKNAGFKPQDATAIADVTRDALAIRCPERSVAEVINGTFRDGVDAVRGALAELIGAREAERKQERINRVRRQREAVA